MIWSKMSDYYEQMKDNFISDIWGMWEDYVRQYIWSDAEDQDLYDELEVYIDENWMEM